MYFKCVRKVAPKVRRLCDLLNRISRWYEASDFTKRCKTRQPIYTGNKRSLTITVGLALYIYKIFRFLFPAAGRSASLIPLSCQISPPFLTDMTPKVNDFQPPKHSNVMKNHNAHFKGILHVPRQWG